jgi:pyruvate dehydrogenase E2 component (dihydrolipoamide acetyltransferase)
MAHNVAIPKLGLTMVEATITEWKAQEGEWVEKEQPILVIEMEKTVHDIEAIASGILHIITPTGQTVPVGHVVGVLAESKEEYATVCREGIPAVAAAPEVEVEASAEVAPEAEAQRVVAPKQGTERLRITPVARKLAEEHSIDVSKISGTGPGGRITRQDILQAVEEREKAAAPAPSPTIAASADKAEMAGLKHAKQVIPLRGMRRAIAENMLRSLQVSAQMTSSGEIDMTEMIKLRQSLVAQQEAIGARITYTDIFVMVVAKALKQNPIINSSIIGDEIRIWDDINIGVAVAMESEDMPGLIVPVVHNADNKSLLEIHNTLSDLTKRARESKLLPDEIAGSTFTITNIGTGTGGAIGEGEGSGFGTPIINQPEVAILGLGGIAEKPVVRGGEIVIRPMMSYSFTTDHRVIDGVPAGRFIATVKQLMENPYLLLS